MTIPTKISRILVPIDFSDTSGAAVDYAAFLAKSFGASVELLHVLDPMLHVSGESVPRAGGPPESITEHGRRIAREEIERSVTRLEHAGVPAKGTLETGVPWERVVHAATRSDLVVMGTHGRTGISRVLLGSVTDKVVQRSTTPVLTVRGADAAVAVGIPTFGLL